jgi:hypothetical protein
VKGGKADDPRAGRHPSRQTRRREAPLVFAFLLRRAARGMAASRKESGAWIFGREYLMNELDSRFRGNDGNVMAIDSCV